MKMPFNPLASFLRAHWLLLTGRLRFPRSRINTTVISDDGTALNVFREATVAGPTAPGARFHVQFHLAGVSPQVNQRFSWLPVPFFVGLPGFRRKLWAVDAATGDMHGLYEWASVQAAERYAHSFAMRFMTARAVPGSIDYEITPLPANPGPPRTQGGNDMRSKRPSLLTTGVLRRVKHPPRLLYRIGLDRVLGRLILLLTTTGRKSGLPRTTPLQYELIDGAYYVASMRGAKADWFRNLQANPCVQVQAGRRRFTGRAEPITDPARVADFIEYRLERHPRLIGRILQLDGMPAQPTRAQLEEYAQDLAMVIIRPVDH